MEALDSVRHSTPVMGVRAVSKQNNVLAFAMICQIPVVRCHYRALFQK